MGAYIQKLKRNKTLNLQLIDGSVARVAQCDYLCRSGQLNHKEWDSDSYTYPQLQSAVTRIQNGLISDPLQADYISIDNVYKKGDIHLTFLRKIKPEVGVKATYVDDYPSGVEDETYVAIKMKKGFVILEYDLPTLFEFAQQNPELWEYNLPVSMWVRINNHYTATVYNLASLHEFLTGHGKGEADKNIWVKRTPTDTTPVWFYKIVEYMCLQEKKRIEELCAA